MPKRPEAPNGASIVRLRDYGAGSVLEVCADQAVPADWMLIEPGENAGRCAGARVDEGEPLTARVQRLR
jgi:hypothetical protein